MVFQKSSERLRIEEELPGVIGRRWVVGTSTAWLELARLVGATYAETIDGKVVERPTQPVVDVIADWERRGLLEKGKKGKLHVPWLFNFSGVPAADATLGPLVAAYLADAEIPIANRQDLRTALRKVLGKLTSHRLPKRSNGAKHDALFVAAAAEIPASKIHRVRELAAECRDDGEYARQVRLLMEYGAEYRLVPFYFPLPQAEDLWDRFRDRIWPQARAAADRVVVQRRVRWNQFKKAAVSLHGTSVVEREPDSLTPQEAMAVVRHARTKLGLIRDSGFMEGLLLHLRDAHGEGPFKSVPACPYIVRGAAGINPRLYLTHRDGSRVADGDWEDLLKAIESHGLPVDEWREGLSWYKTYITEAPSAYRELVQKEPDRYPDRPAGRRLSRNTLRKRHMTLKAVVGIAIRLCPEAAANRPTSRLMDPQDPTRPLAPGELVPNLVFGALSPHIIDAIMSEWKDRAAFVAKRRKEGLPEEDRCSHEVSAGLLHIVIGSALISIALYDRARLERKATLAKMRASKRLHDGKEGSRGVDRRGEALVERTETETFLFEAYESAYTKGGGFEAERASGNEETGDSNTVKVVERILETTPAPYWLKLLRYMLARLERMRRDPTARGRLAFAQFATHTLMLAFLIATGCRESELHCIDLSYNFSPRNRKERIVRWKAGQRKNRRPHVGRLAPAIVPEWLLTLYIDEVRPWLMQHRLQEKGRPEDVQRHTFLFVTQQGCPLASLSESEDGQPGELQSDSNRGVGFINTLGRSAADIGLEIPAGDAEFAEHAVRAAMGDLVRREQGLEKAAAFLGDTQRSVELYYSRVDGRQVDLSEYADIAEQLAGPAKRNGRALSSLRGPSLLDELERLAELADRLNLGPEEREAFSRTLAMQHGVGTAS